MPILLTLVLLGAAPSDGAALDEELPALQAAEAADHSLVVTHLVSSGAATLPCILWVPVLGLCGSGIVLTGMAAGSGSGDSTNCLLFTGACTGFLGVLALVPGTLAAGLAAAVVHGAAAAVWSSIAGRGGRIRLAAAGMSIAAGVLATLVTGLGMAGLAVLVGWQGTLWATGSSGPFGPPGASADLNQRIMLWAIVGEAMAGLLAGVVLPWAVTVGTFPLWQVLLGTVLGPQER